MSEVKEQSAYARAGVDIDAATDAVDRMKAHIKKTLTPGVLTGVGSFGGMFALSSLGALQDPVLVSSIDGVGTKLKIAFATNRHDTIGRDLVNHCINDILVQGARPLFFLGLFRNRQITAPRRRSRGQGPCRWLSSRRMRPDRRRDRRDARPVRRRRIRPRREHCRSGGEIEDRGRLQSRPRRRPHRPRLRRPAHQRLLPRPPGPPARRRPPAGIPRPRAWRPNPRRHPASPPTAATPRPSLRT